MTIIATMSELSIQLPPGLQRWVDLRVSAGRYADAGEYVRDLMRRDQEALDDDVRRVRALVEEGLASGIVDREPEDVLEDIIAGIGRKDGLYRHEPLLSRICSPSPSSARKITGRKRPENS